MKTGCYCACMQYRHAHNATMAIELSNSIIYVLLHLDIEVRLTSFRDFQNKVVNL